LLAYSTGKRRKRILRGSLVDDDSTIFFNMDPSKPKTPQVINKEIATKLTEESETYGT
jgi:hypothetical protein